MSQGIGQLPPNAPHIIPNPLDNTILVMGTPQDIEQIKTLVTQLDVPPRQVLIDAKIYEVDLDNEFAGGVESYLQKVGSTSATGVTGNNNRHNRASPGLLRATALTYAGGPGGLALTDWGAGIQEQPTDRSLEYGGKPRKIARHLRSQHHRDG